MPMKEPDTISPKDLIFKLLLLSNFCNENKLINKGRNAAIPTVANMCKPTVPLKISTTKPNINAEISNTQPLISKGNNIIISG